jgi:hypothetical protein
MSVFPAADIPAAITALYAHCSMCPVELPQTVVPLGDLVGGFNLSCEEVSGLTVAACAHLGEAVDAAEREALAGFLYATPRWGVIFVERMHPVQRRRFSAAHELGHYLLHFRPAFERAAAAGEEIVGLTDAFPPEREEKLEAPPLGCVAPADPSGSLPLLPPLAQMEDEADRFAAELLMPRSLVRALRERYAGQFHDADLAQRLAVELLVSRAAMFRRLRELGLIGRCEFSPDELN